VIVGLRRATSVGGPDTRTEKPAASGTHRESNRSRRQVMAQRNTGAADGSSRAGGPRREISVGPATQHKSSRCVPGTHRAHNERREGATQTQAQNTLAPVSVMVAGPDDSLALQPQPGTK
jgi:hypothetical protein